MLNKKEKKNLFLKKKNTKSRDLHVDTLPDQSSALANPLNPKPMPL